MILRKVRIRIILHDGGNITNLSWFLNEISKKEANCRYQLTVVCTLLNEWSKQFNFPFNVLFIQVFITCSRDQVFSLIFRKRITHQIKIYPHLQMTWQNSVVFENTENISTRLSSSPSIQNVNPTHSSLLNRTQLTTCQWLKSGVWYIKDKKADIDFDFSQTARRADAQNQNSSLGKQLISVPGTWIRVSWK